MCLQPLTIRNPTKAVNTDGGQLLKMTVSCGHCAECVQSKRNEWFIRCHYECERTFSKGGYVYFDTLTYADEHLPRLSHHINNIKEYGIADFSCFSHEDFKKFLKRLRRRIHYKYGYDSSAFRYFLTSEYGTDERRTHRPHYHILFYVYVPIPPIALSQLVADCWQYGRTDGYPFKPYTYVQQHVYAKENCPYATANADFTTIESVCHYVSKYITKHSKFTEKLNKRIALLEMRIKDTEVVKELKRKMDMFHRQSKGFGLSYLDSLTPEKLMFIDEDKVIMKDSDKISKTYPLPMYYKRHLFYNLKKHFDGSRYWELSDTGLSHQIQMKLKSVDKQALKYMDILNNCSNDELKTTFFEFLGDRDIADLVIYEQFYKGRHRHKNAYNPTTNLIKEDVTDEEINLNDWLLSLRASARPYLDMQRCVSRSDNIIQSRVKTQEEHTKHLDIHSNAHGYLTGNSVAMDFTHYIKNNTFNQYSCKEFNHFDDLASVITEMTKYQRENVQVTFEFIEDLKEKYKTLFNQKL